MKFSNILKFPSVSRLSKRVWCLTGRQYLIITYQSDAQAIRAALPKPLQADGSNTVQFVFAATPGEPGRGSSVESGLVIPARFNGLPVNFNAQLYVNDDLSLLGGHEIWGFPKMPAYPRLLSMTDELAGVIEYGEHAVAIGTMGYGNQYGLHASRDYQRSSQDEIATQMSKTHVNLKIIPDVDGSPALAQLVAYQFANIAVRDAWSGPARLNFTRHPSVPVAELPVKSVLGGVHFVADLTLPLGRVLHDYRPARRERTRAHRTGIAPGRAPSFTLDTFALHT